MLRKIIACFVLVTFFITIFPSVEVAEAIQEVVEQQRSWLDEGALLAGAGIIIAIVLIVIIAKASSSKQVESNPSHVADMPKENASSLNTSIEKRNINNIRGIDYALSTNQQNHPIEFSESGVIILKW